jgi:FAD/FMN-containing dehydrogenase
MTHAADIQSFKAAFGSRVQTPGDADYDRLRSLWNGAIDRRPAVIAHCETSGQVADAIRFGRRHGLQIAVRGGGHSYAGHSACDGGLMIHLGATNRVAVDPAARRVRCGGGATWAEVDAATQQHGLAAPGGFVSHTGVGGLTLGGGIGWLTKMAGLSCDNLVGAELVTADSRVVQVSAQHTPELLWALRGGGGNFGVVTSFEFTLHPVGPLVHLGLFFFGLDRGAQALRFAREYIETLPGNATGFLAIGLSAPPAPFVPQEHHFKPGHALLVAGFGTGEQHAAAVAPIRDAVTPLFEFVTPLPYVALQQLFDESAVWGLQAYQKSLYLDELSDPVIGILDQHLPQRASPLSFCPTFAMNGAYRSVGDDGTAFGGSRNARYVINIEALSPERAGFEADRAWVRRLWEALLPHASGDGGYVNFMADTDAERVRASYGDAKYRRLARIKAEYDPDNVFRLNANIEPAAS